MSVNTKGREKFITLLPPQFLGSNFYYIIYDIATNFHALASQSNYLSISHDQTQRRIGMLQNKMVEFF